MTRSARTHPTLAVAALAVAALAALALAGCAGSGEPGASSSADDGASVSAGPSVEASPSPEPAAEPVAEPAAPEPGAEPATGVNSIATPSDGATVPGPQVDVTGMGTAFEATLLWRVARAGTDDVVTESFTTAGANGEVGPYAFTIELTPGVYTLEVWEPGMSDEGEGDGSDRRGLVASTFTVS